ncbi:MAG: sigma-70 family RNA polymerase sigma factor [Tannerellaceae bacterium]|nr:sigma-70 family RNA polymerase sigma factor [Tannerellaceae bacterium]
MKQERLKNEVIPLRNQLVFYAQRLLNNTEESEDIVQEVFLKLWYMREELDQYNSIPALSVQITKHLCLNQLKVLQRVCESPKGQYLASPSLNPHLQLGQKDQVTQVMRIIDRLPNLQQTVLRMKHVDGFEVEEIAELTGSTPEAIRMNLSRVRKRVKELFQKMQ